MRRLIRAAALLLAALSTVPPASARADCMDDAEALVPQAKAITNQIASRVALQELHAAVEDGTEDGESFCVEHLAAAQRAMAQQPFHWQPGETVDHPDDSAPQTDSGD